MVLSKLADLIGEEEFNRLTTRQQMRVQGLTGQKFSGKDGAST